MTAARRFMKAAVYKHFSYLAGVFLLAHFPCYYLWCFFSFVDVWWRALRAVQLILWMQPKATSSLSSQLRYML